MKQKNNGDWFKSWFDTAYYHLLYKDRGFEEAQIFVDKLVKYLKPKPEAHFLEMACGKGRHASYLNKKGFRVSAFDLSENSIYEAKKMENATLHFFVHDIRKPIQNYAFDYITNLFTSFGYFENMQDDISVFQSVANSLKPNGSFVLDFMNSIKVEKKLVSDEKKKIENIEFNITRRLENGFFIKEITFNDKGIAYDFQEKVKALKMENFQGYCKKVGLKIITTFGNYNLDEFRPTMSDRLILVIKKA